MLDDICSKFFVYLIACQIAASLSMVIPTTVLGVALYQINRMKVLRSDHNQHTFNILLVIAVVATPSYSLGILNLQN